MNEARAERLRINQLEDPEEMALFNEVQKRFKNEAAQILEQLCPILVGRSAIAMMLSFSCLIDSLAVTMSNEEHMADHKNLGQLLLLGEAMGIKLPEPPEELCTCYASQLVRIGRTIQFLALDVLREAQLEGVIK